jgi:hypothetical protein
MNNSAKVPSSSCSLAELSFDKSASGVSYLRERALGIQEPLPAATCNIAFIAHLEGRILPTKQTLPDASNDYWPAC